MGHDTVATDTHLLLALHRCTAGRLLACSSLLREQSRSLGAFFNQTSVPCASGLGSREQAGRPLHHIIKIEQQTLALVALVAPLHRAVRRSLCIGAPRSRQNTAASSFTAEERCRSLACAFVYEAMRRSTAAWVVFETSQRRCSSSAREL